MSQYTRPDEKVFAQSAKVGEVESFPDVERGWGVAFEQSDGIPPMEWFNGLGKRTDESIRYLLQKGISDWSATEDYPLNAYVQHKNKMWVAVRANINEQPLMSSAWIQTALTIEEIKRLIPDVPVKSVNGKLNHVVLNAQDVGSFERSKNLADADPVIVRKNLRLGAAALRDVGVANNQLMQVGAFGLGNQQTQYTNVTTANNLLTTGFYFVASTVKDIPKLNDSYILVHVGVNTVYQDLTVANSGEKFSRIKRGNSWSNWQLVITDVNSFAITTPVGVPMPWPNINPPSGWLKCNGASFDKNRFPLLAKAYPAGVLPDLRGEFIRGWDDGRGVDEARGILTDQNDAMQKITGYFRSIDRNYDWIGGSAYLHSRWSTSIKSGAGDGWGTNVMFDSSREVRTAEETRPRNIAFLYIVRAA
ncbi:phage tail protein [Pragia fontium]|uniref:phage tail protein n=1 Tax=Pragia fontium TaxID=82985 RepID=UPI0008FF7C4E|nr:phage tail protein [Pragia fontium]